jgi:hypothetical protein
VPERPAGDHPDHGSGSGVTAGIGRDFDRGSTVESSIGSGGMVGEATTEQRQQVIDINRHVPVGDSPDAPKVAPTVAPIQSATEPATTVLPDEFRGGLLPRCNSRRSGYKQIPKEHRPLEG